MENLPASVFRVSQSTLMYHPEEVGNMSTRNTGIYMLMCVDLYSRILGSPSSELWDVHYQNYGMSVIRAMGSPSSEL